MNECRQRGFAGGILLVDDICVVASGGLNSSWPVQSSNTGVMGDPVRADGELSVVPDLL